MEIARSSVQAVHERWPRPPTITIAKEPLLRVPLRAFGAALIMVAAALTPVTSMTHSAQAASPKKVAIIVGPTEITDSLYMEYAEEMAITAETAGATVDLRYCATPAEARAAVNGANIIVYFGHGNGFPNPYSPTENPASVNGWGLRDPAKPWSGDDCRDDVLRYYGEDYLVGKRTGNGWDGPITPAANFVMVYSNACYAPGAGEARPAPAEPVAVSRVANYASPILELGGTSFASDIGSGSVVDLILRNPDVSFGRIFEMGNGFKPEALRRFSHPDVPGAEAWVHRTTSPWLGDDYWYAFAGNPARTPNGGYAEYAGPRLSISFGDIAGSPFYGDIMWMAEEGITSGCGGGKFCPKAAVTREQMASFLVRALNLPTTSTDYFTDDGASGHQPDINSLAASGITGGCAVGRFCPKDTVTREQMASFLVRGLHLAPAGSDSFTDDDASPHENDINSLAASGITGGCGTAKFCPSAKVVREQMAAFLHRALGD